MIWYSYRAEVGLSAAQVVGGIPGSVHYYHYYYYYYYYYYDYIIRIIVIIIVIIIIISSSIVVMMMSIIIIIITIILIISIIIIIISSSSSSSSSSSRQIPFMRAFALQSSDTHSSPALDLVIWEPTFQRVFFFRRSFLSQTPVGRQGIGSVCTEFRCFGATPSRPTPLLVHFWQTLVRHQIPPEGPTHVFVIAVRLIYPYKVNSAARLTSQPKLT